MLHMYFYDGGLDDESIGVHGVRRNWACLMTSENELIFPSSIALSSNPCV